MMMPRINLNGTNPHELHQQYLDALRDLEDAIETVRKLDIHGRDYQTLPVGSYAVAMAEHRTRLTRLNRVRNELYQIISDLDRQMRERARSGGHDD
jgi:hypothetical protein